VSVAGVAQMLTSNQTQELLKLNIFMTLMKDGGK
jgi:hypothetical protein